VSLEFLAPDAAASSDAFAPVARSPMERDARAAGARFDVRDGWNVAVDYGSSQQEAETSRRTAGWADVSYLGKLELQASPEDLQAIAASCTGGGSLELGTARRAAGAWWCQLTQTRLLVVCEPAALPGLRERLEDAAAGAASPASVIEVTNVLAALTLVGPLAREIFARFTAIDLRPQATPVAGLRPGSIARQPSVLVREAQDRFLFLFGWAVGQYMWTVVSDAGRHLGAVPIGVDALDPVGEPAEEVRTGA
jgi:heterotetrameric sarcosine oxidase gamma subunit